MLDHDSSSGSFSEDDFFEHLIGVPEVSSYSERENESSPKASQKRTSEKTSKKSKKKKRREFGQKGSGSGSDSESKGSTQHEDSISNVRTFGKCTHTYYTCLCCNDVISICIMYMLYAIN